jgi:hypothetical protein
VPALRALLQDFLACLPFLVSISSEHMTPEYDAKVSTVLSLTGSLVRLRVCVCVCAYVSCLANCLLLQRDHTLRDFQRLGMVSVAAVVAQIATGAARDAKMRRLIADVSLLFPLLA